MRHPTLDPSASVRRLFRSRPCPQTLEGLELLGLSVTTIAVALGLATCTVALWRTGHSAIPPRHLGRLNTLLRQAMTVARVEMERLPAPQSDHGQRLRWRMARAEKLLRQASGPHA